MIELRSVSKWYGEVIGLNDVTVSIGPGVTALLGMNGAGKSTLMKLVTGQLQPTTGEVTVFGEAPFANPTVYRRLGYCPEVDQFYEQMTGREFVRHLARLAGYPAAEATERTNRVIAAVGMSDRADKRLAGFSKGMRQRIKLAQAMVHDPDAILLDEPLNGLDPVARREFIELLAGLAAQGKTVLVSSHILFEVEQMTRSILLLNRGRLLAAGDLSTIREILDKYPHRVRIESPQPRQLAEWAVGRSHLLSIRIDEDRDRLDLEIREPDAFYRELSDAIRSGEVSITAFHSPDNNLESIFHYLVQA